MVNTSEIIIIIAVAFGLFGLALWNAEQQLKDYTLENQESALMMRPLPVK